ncbi:hypothetical protein H5410_038244 [Solanum commersonii]|uniref:Ubiquitin-like protease family profile domain-containing protein n=1 Tax=Solanum commersonii TaxID=4109 RepID=A0A9J5YCK1_SOLCO|nr:hypothetical protein H5410_038244 [Solanum commersonii]
MDAQSPSKRFTRGIPLHVENSVERPSFSLGLTQDFGEVAGSMSKSNAMQEIKSKLKNDPIRLEEMSAKSKQSNIKIVEGGKKDQSAVGSNENAKRKEVVVSGLLEQDEAVKFLGKREPTHIPQMQCYTNIEVMKVLATKLTSSQYKEFCGTTCFAQLSSIRRCHVQAQLIRCMFLREIEDNEKDFVFNTEEPNRIILQYFGVEKAITKSQLVEKFDNMVWEDMMMMQKDFDLVESGRYIDYPWGKKAFDLLILHLHTKIKHNGKYFRLYGFPLALQVWFYECCSSFDKEIVVKVSHHIPRILNWKTKKDFPRLSYFAKGMFRDDNNSLVFNNITPTPMELKILELPPEQTVTHIQNKTTPRIISKQPCLRKSPRRANLSKRPKSPLPKRQAKKHANVPSYTSIKQNVEIKSSVAFEIPSTSKSRDFSISRDEFDQFKLSKQFNDLRNFIENNFKVVLDSIKSKNAEDKGDGVEVTEDKVRNSPSSTPEVSIHQSNLHSPTGQSALSPLVQQFSNPEPQKENCEDVPIKVVKEGSRFMDDQTDFNNSSFGKRRAIQHIALCDIIRLSAEWQRRNTKEQVYVLQMWFHFGIITIQNKKLVIYRLAYKNQLLDDSYIRILRMHVARPWHIDNILIPCNIEEIFHWILIVVSINDRSIRIYDSLRGVDFYGKKGIDISSHPSTSPSECDSFEMIYVNDIPQQDLGEATILVMEMWFQNPSIEFTCIDMLLYCGTMGCKRSADATSGGEARERSTEDS